MFAKMKLGTKVSAGFGLAVALLATVGVVGYLSLRSVNGNLSTMAGLDMPSVEHILTISDAQMRIWVGERGLINPRMMDPKVRQAQYDFIAEAWGRLDEASKAYEALPRGAEHVAAWNEFKLLFADWKTKHEEVVALSRDKDQLRSTGVALTDARIAALDDRAFAASLTARAAMLKTDEMLKKMREAIEAEAARNAAAGASAARSAQTAVIVALLVGALALVAFGVVFARAIGRIVSSLLGETRKLTDAAVNGQLAVRGDPQAINFEFRPIIEGVNTTLDAVIGPLNVAAEYVDRISKGDVPAKITDTYKGDFNEIKNNLNVCIETVGALVADTGSLVQAAVRGRLQARADASRHQGDWRRIVDGVNRTLDSIVGNLEAIPMPLQFVDREFRLQYINKAGADLLGRTQQQLLGQRCADVWQTAKCASRDCPCQASMDRNGAHTCENTCEVNGKKYDIFCAAAPLRDEHGQVIGSFEFVADQSDVKQAARKMQKVADYQTRETEKITAALQQLAAGDLSVHVDLAASDADTQDAFDLLQRILMAVRGFKEAVIRLSDDANQLAAAAVAGQLNNRADASKHQGDFRKIIDGINSTLDAVVTPIQEAAKILENLANYDLRARMQGEYQGDHAKIKASLNQTAQALHDALAQVAEAVDQVSSASQQIAASSQQVAEGSSEQASSLEETSSSLEEMASMTKQNADNTQQAKALTDATRGAADRGTVSMRQMVEAMGKIRTASEGTAQIIRDINEIAFQTNLLALNAAVEAARAGDAGRGFAVVAEEVRNLAQRAKEAAKKTEDLINESVALSEGGEKISREVGENLEGILASVNKVSEIMNEVATASQEQSRGIEQVNAAVAEMDKVVQAAAASAEESSSASQELASQAQELAAMVGRFQLQRAASAPARTAASPARPAGPAAASRAKSGKHRPAPASREGWRLKPEDVIPLDSETELARF